MNATAHAYREPQVIAFSSIKPGFSFDALAEQFLDQVDRKETTERGYKYKLARFSSWIKDNGIVEPTRTDLKDYRDYLKDSDLATGTQVQYLRAVLQCFKWAAAEGLYKSIAENIHSPKTRNDHHKKDALTSHDVVEIESFINRNTADGKRLYALWMLSTNCGLRTIELYRADVCDLNTIGGEPFLSIQRKGHDEKDARVYLNPETYKAVKEYLDARTDSYTPKSPLFVSTSNRSLGKRLSTKSISTLLKDAMKRAGYDSARLTAHSLRHTSATAAFNAGCSLYEVQHAQGHANPGTTEIYIHDSNSVQSEIKVRTAIYEQLHGDEQTIEKRNRATALIQSLDAQVLDEVIAYLSGLQTTK